MHADKGEFISEKIVFMNKIYNRVLLSYRKILNMQIVELQRIWRSNFPTFLVFGGLQYSPIYGSSADEPGQSGPCQGMPRLQRQGVGSLDGFR